MPGLVVDNCEIFVRRAEQVREWDNAKGPVVSVCGQERNATKFIRRAWSFTSCFTDCDSAKGLKSLISGRGHRISFADGLDASTCMNPSEPLPSNAFLRTSPGAFGEPGWVETVAGAGELLRYPAQADDEWTVIWCEDPGSTGTWTTRVVTSVAPVAPGTVVSVSEDNGDIVFDRIASGGIDEISIYPFIASQMCIDNWLADKAVQFPGGPLPYMHAYGDLLCEDEPILVYGDVSSSEIVQLCDPAVGPEPFWQLQFTLREVNPVYTCPDILDPEFGV